VGGAWIVPGARADGGRAGRCSPAAVVRPACRPRIMPWSGPAGNPPAAHGRKPCRTSSDDRGEAGM